jgi:hypothetical protein
LFKQPLTSVVETKPIAILKKDAELPKTSFDDSLFDRLGKLTVDKLSDIICEMSADANKAELLQLEKSTLRYFIKKLLEESESESVQSTSIVEENPVTVVEKVVSTISNTVPSSNQSSSVTISTKEFEQLKKTVQSLSQKLVFNGMGGGGTGVVRIGDTDDFDKQSYSDGRYLRWKDGMFRLDELTAGDVINNTILVNTQEYYVLETDWYIGVQYPGICTIHLPVSATNGKNLVIKDESGNCGNNPIIITGTIDNDVGGVNLQINNAAIHMVYRSGWRII